MNFFNTTNCQPISQTQDIDRPIFGWEVKFSLVTKRSEQATSQLILTMMITRVKIQKEV